MLVVTVGDSRVGDTSQRQLIEYCCLHHGQASHKFLKKNLLFACSGKFSGNEFGSLRFWNLMLEVLGRCWISVVLNHRDRNVNIFSYDAKQFNIT